MKAITNYVCSYCNRKYATASECEKHEEECEERFEVQHNFRNADCCALCKHFTRWDCGLKFGDCNVNGDVKNINIYTKFTVCDLFER